MPADALEWLSKCDIRSDLVLTNLFLHHFSHEELRNLLRGVARLTPAFLALEPRRSWWSLAVSRMVGCIGCNRVTRHDAPASVRAGFDGQELSDLWSCSNDWTLQEQRAGWFSHTFLASRSAPTKG